MKFSVILPVYNREHCVADSIKSVVEQSYPDWELIAVDDGSKDNSFEVCNEIAKKDSRIKVISQENKGISGARNSGMKAASGDYILFLDSDDYMEPGAMERLAEAVEQYNEPDMICGGFRSSSGSECLPDESICDVLHDKEYIYNNIIPEHVNVHPQTKFFLQAFVWNKCFRRAFLEKAGIQFDEWRRTWEDNVFFVSCLALAKNIVIKRIAFVFYSDNDAGNRLSSTCNTNMLYGYIKSYEEYKQQFGDIYNFNNPYTNKRYFTYLCNILFRLYKGLPAAEFDEVLDNVLNDGNVAFWMKNVKTSNLTDLRIVRAYRKKDKALLKLLLEKKAQLGNKESAFSRMYRRARRLLSRVKRILLKILRSN